MSWVSGAGGRSAVDETGNVEEEPVETGDPDESPSSEDPTNTPQQVNDFVGIIIILITIFLFCLVFRKEMADIYQEFVRSFTYAIP